MHPHHHGCCGHGRDESTELDPRFADDEFTQAAAHERRVRAAHAHGLSVLGLIFGGIFFVHIARRLFGSR